MHLLYRDSNGTLRRTEFHDNKPAYAILSHRWILDEPSFQDITNGTAKTKSGFGKLQFCANQAAADGLKYFWVDTVCIDKSSSAELTEALNSMFRWYREATKCYVYLSDVSAESQLQGSLWFTRGWTLQELISPKIVEFFSSKGVKLGSKASLERRIHSITGIPVEALRGHSLSNFSISERMSWAEKRVTKREEDQAYCLLGIFDVFMPIIYGEGKRAFTRLREEIEKSSKGSGSLVQQQLVYNNGYNCWRPIKWSTYGFINSWKIAKCQRCKFKMSEDVVPAGLTMSDGRTVPTDVMWARFHYQPSLAKGPVDGKFRCFICQDDKEMDWADIKKHVARNHTYSQICEPNR